MGRELHLILLRLTLDTFIPKYYIVSMMSTNRSLASLNKVLISSELRREPIFLFRALNLCNVLFV